MVTIKNLSYASINPVYKAICCSKSHTLRMARILRGDFGWGFFPKLELVSIAIGGFCGYKLGAGAYEEESLLRKTRTIDEIKKTATEALREVDLYNKQMEELKRSLSEMKTAAQELKQKSRDLEKLEVELAKRERKVGIAEKKAENEKYIESEG